MKKMALVIAVLTAIALGGYVGYRHYRRLTDTPAAPAGLPIPPVRAEAEALRQLDAWQGGIKLAPATDYAAEAAGRKRALEKLRQEEQRQKPWEGRN